MEASQADGSDGDHDAIKDDKVGLILHDGIAPATRHLADTEDATGEDGDVGEAEARDEDLEFGVAEDFGGGGGEFRAAGAGAEGVVGDEDAEGEEGEDLPDDTGHHEVVAGVLH